MVEHKLKIPFEGGPYVVLSLVGNEHLYRLPEKTDPFAVLERLFARYPQKSKATADAAHQSERRPVPPLSSTALATPTRSAVARDAEHVPPPAVPEGSSSKSDIASDDLSGPLPPAAAAAQGGLF